MFVSRNNDAAGYWGIGRLYKTAAGHGAQTLEITLAPDGGTETLEDLQIVKLHFQTALQKQLSAAHLAHVPVSEGRIRIRFGVAEESLRGSERFGYGQPIECVVGLKLSSGHYAEASARCRAATHDPNRELRRRDAAAPAVASSPPSTPRSITS